MTSISDRPVAQPRSIQMNTDVAHDVNPMNKALGHLVWPSQMRSDAEAPADGLRTARWAAGALTVVLTAVQLVVWLMISIISKSVDTPWWLWSTIPGVVVTGFLSWMISTRDQLGIQRQV
jgi:hypothetical protein